MIIYAALLVAFVVPLIFLYGIHTFDLYGTGKFWLNYVVLGWGAAAYLVAAQINPYLIESGTASYEMVIRVYGPIIEELLKSFILIYLIRRADFNYVVDGALYGFGAGIGFAIIENYEYVMGHPDQAIIVAIARVFSTNLVHATGSGVIGTALAYWRGNPGARGRQVILLGYIFAMMMHVIFNTMVNTGIALMIAILYGGLGVFLIWRIIQSGMNVQKQWVSETLGAEDKVTGNETKIVSNIDKLEEALAPIRKHFGKEKAEMVKRFLQIQGEIGIKRKLLEATPSESKKQEMLSIIQDLGKEMDVLRKKVGHYCMLEVRTVYMTQDIKVFDMIGSRIAETSTGQKGGGLFDRATSRIKRKPETESNPAQEDKP